jgi:hypothetical protein
VLEKCEYLGIDPDDSDYYILYDAIRSYGSMRLGISGFVVSASYMMVAVKGMREEQGREGKEENTHSVRLCLIKQWASISKQVYTSIKMAVISIFGCRFLANVQRVDAEVLSSSTMLRTGWTHPRKIRLCPRSHLSCRPCRISSAAWNAFL